jgi:hypothetical protein
MDAIASAAYELSSATMMKCRCLVEIDSYSKVHPQRPSAQLKDSNCVEPVRQISYNGLHQCEMSHYFQKLKIEAPGTGQQKGQKKS